MRLSKLKSGVALALVAAAGLATIGFGWTVANWQLDTAWRVHVERIETDLQVRGERVGYRLQSIGENLRSIAVSAGVRRLQSGSEPLNPLDLENIQQIVSKLQSKFANAQVYVVPASYNSVRLDASTGQFQAPAICFNCVTPETAKAIETYGRGLSSQTVSFSQRQAIADQLDWFGKTYPDRASISGLDTPVISSGVIQISTNQSKPGILAADFPAVAFATPFFDRAGKFAGIVSAAIPTESLTKLVPYGPYAIESPLTEYKSHQLSAVSGDANWTPAFHKDGDVSTTFGSQHEITTSDPRGFWLLQARYGAISFYQSPEYLVIKQYAKSALAAALLLTGLGMAWVFASRRRALLLKHNATHDALTGLANRVLLENYMQLAVADMVRKKTSAMVLYLDLDRFKFVNDTLGHHVGDLVLKEASRIIKHSIRTNDVLARMGGDEFVVLMRDCTDPADAMSVATRIINNLSTPKVLEGHAIHIGTTIGISIMRADVKCPNEVLRCADLALFRAKAEERGSYRFYEPEMDAERLRRRQLEMDLRNALQNNELLLHYQPIINSATGAISSCEALVRWQHPEHGLIPPLKFIPIAEELGLINKIGEWVLNQACLDAAKMPTSIQMAVNVSALQIKNPVFPLQVIKALNAANLSPQRLELELTESIMATGEDIIINNVKRLRNAGVRIALDDFGVGFSSFSCLKDFEFDRIKIDRSFLQNIERSKEAAIFHAIANMGQELGVSTTAEGVETEAQLKTVLQQGCTEAQGFFFSRPKPLHELNEFVEKHTAQSRSRKAKSA